MLSEMSQTELDKYPMISLICRPKKQNKQNRNKLTHTENILTVSRWERGCGVSEKGEGIREYRLVVTNSHGEVQYSTGNTVGNVVITVYGVRWGLDLLG